MMKRKMMAAVLTMAMAATMIGGCGNSTDTSNAGNSTNTTESSADAADTAKMCIRDSNIDEHRLEELFGI